MKLYIFAVFTLLLTILVPATSEAYLTTNQTATDLGNKQVLFTVTYKFGFLNREVYMPILAKRNKDFADTGTNAGYSILLNGKTDAKATSSTMTNADASFTLNYSVLPGKAQAIVLSDTEIKDGRYYLPKGKSAEFTLIALVDMSKSASTDELSLLMTSLPFTMIDKGKALEARLNPSELQYYKTPAVSLRK